MTDPTQLPDRVGRILAAAEEAAEQLRADAERRARERIAEADRASTMRVEAAEGEAVPHLPFDDGRFDVVLARHEAYDASEAACDWTGVLTFADVAALMFYLRMTRWQVPDDFTVERHADVLLALYRSGAPLCFTQRRFVLRARRPAPAPA